MAARAGVSQMDLALCVQSATIHLQTAHRRPPPPPSTHTHHKRPSQIIHLVHNEPVRLPWLRFCFKHPRFARAWCSLRESSLIARPFANHLSGCRSCSPSCPPWEPLHRPIHIPPARPAGLVGCLLRLSCFLLPLCLCCFADFLFFRLFDTGGFEALCLDPLYFCCHLV